MNKIMFIYLYLAFYLPIMILMLFYIAKVWPLQACLFNKSKAGDASYPGGYQLPPTLLTTVPVLRSKVTCFTILRLMRLETNHWLLAQCQLKSNSKERKTSSHTEYIKYLTKVHMQEWTNKHWPANRRGLDYEQQKLEKQGLSCFEK